MEGEKGGTTAEVLNYYTAKRSSLLRWEDYQAAQIQAGLPVYGSHSLFKKLWKAHSEITECSAKHHPKCDRYVRMHCSLHKPLNSFTSLRICT
eukprot:4170635-Pleurochrysis_carterae.AAC.1